jgi:hypothetical protein
MKRTRLFGWLRWATILVALALAAFAIVAIRSLREPVLRAAGWALVVNNESAAPADIIVLTIDSDGAGALEAADLVRLGNRKKHTASAFFALFGAQECPLCRHKYSLFNALAWMRHVWGHLGEQ